MKRLIASFAALGLIAAPALATTNTAANLTQAPAKGKSHKNAKKAAKVKAAPSTSKTSN